MPRLLMVVLVLLLGRGAALAQEVALDLALDFPRARLAVQTSDGLRHPFTVEVASTPRQLAQGLMFRRALPADAGMLFDFGETRPIAMWMRNTFIPLDMLFLAADGRIIDIAERTVPHSLAPLGPAEPGRAVLEVPGGTAGRLGIRPGDRVLHPLFGNAP